MNRILLTALLAATFSLSGCDSKDTSPTVGQADENPAPVNTTEGVTIPAVSSEDAEDEYPRLTWKQTHAPSGSNVTGTSALTSFDVVEDRVRQLDWSSEAADLPSIIVELDSINSLTIEIDASVESGGRPIIATWERAGETKGSTTAVLIKRSKPLKDVEHGLALLRAHFAGDDLESLTEWAMP